MTGDRPFSHVTWVPLWFLNGTLFKKWPQGETWLEHTDCCKMKQMKRCMVIKLQKIVSRQAVKLMFTSIKLVMWVHTTLILLFKVFTFHVLKPPGFTVQHQPKLSLPDTGAAAAWGSFVKVLTLKIKHFKCGFQYKTWWSYFSVYQYFLLHPYTEECLEIQL